MLSRAFGLQLLNLGHCSGDVYGWGYNDNFELGLGAGTSRNSPQMITALGGKNVTRIVAGQAPSLPLCLPTPLPPSLQNTTP